VIAYKNGAPVRLSEVAEIVDGAENVRLAAWAPGPTTTHRLSSISSASRAPTL